MYFMFQKLGLLSKYVFLIERPTTVGWGPSHFLQNNPQPLGFKRFQLSKVVDIYC